LTEPTSASAFERLVAGPCPPPAELLLAVAAELRPVNLERTSFRLDELARGLFAAALGRDPAAIPRRLARLLIEEARFRGEPEPARGLLLDEVLARRAGHPLALAVVAAEVARRAGVEVAVCSTPTGWYAAMGTPSRLWLIDPAVNPGPAPAGPVRRHCGHELAFVALGGLAQRLAVEGDRAGARRAAALRARLPVVR
jgi:regulator of sirC expression with transglutaminase-like and TPR domain